MVRTYVQCGAKSCGTSEPVTSGPIQRSRLNSALVVLQESSVATAAMSSLTSASTCVMYGHVPPLDLVDDWKRHARPEHDEVVK